MPGLTGRIPPSYTGKRGGVHGGLLSPVEGEATAACAAGTVRRPEGGLGLRRDPGRRDPGRSRSEPSPRVIVPALAGCPVRPTRRSADDTHPHWRARATRRHPRGQHGTASPPRRPLGVPPRPRGGPGCEAVPPAPEHRPGRPRPRRF